MGVCGPAMTDTPKVPARKTTLSPEAERALAEAEARRAAEAADAEARAKLPEDERGGPKAIEPTRYGDWERKGIAYDF